MQIQRFQQAVAHEIYVSKEEEQVDSVVWWERETGRFEISHLFQRREISESFSIIRVNLHPQ